MTKTKTQGRVTVRMSPELKRGVERLAKARGCPQNDIMATAIAQYVQDNKAKREPA